MTSRRLALLASLLVLLLVVACSQGHGAHSDGGAGPEAGPFGEGGGKGATLVFAVVGDTRPATEDDTAGYPTGVIESIFVDIAARAPQPAFVVATGDYMFASAGGGQAETQLGLYTEARARFSGPLLAAMGNHECTGWTASNCGPGNTDGVTPNYSAFLALLLSPIHQTLPYYSARYDALDGSWTSKLVVVAANAWDQGQASWLVQAMAVPTTYTFVVRHEPSDATTAPGTVPSEAIVGQYPVTLEICGHTHSYFHDGNRVVLGNGGAPLGSGKSYGYGLVQRRADGSLDVDEIDYQSGQADPSFHFRVEADGTVGELAIRIP
jgi:hypothetical protein